MTDNEPASADFASQSLSSAPVDADANAAVATATELSPPNESVKESTSPESKPEEEWPDADIGTPPGANGKDSNKESKKPPVATYKGKNRKHSKEKVNKNDEKDKDKDGQSEGKAPKKEKVEPYVNEDRVKTGGTPREKLSTEELEARMERIRLNNEKIKQRRAAVEADEQAFQESQAALRARQAQQRKIQASINEKRAAVAKRKMERAGGREWDNFKTPSDPDITADAENGTNASMHAPKPQEDAMSANESTSEANNGWPMTDDQESPRGGNENERGRGSGRRAGRARGRGGRGTRGRGSGRGRGGGAFGELRRDKAPHIKDPPQDSTQQESNAADWGTGADEWGKASDAEEIQTGIAITTSEDDPWGSTAGDDPWGTPQKS